jgi:predicted ester cyclase
MMPENAPLQEFAARYTAAWCSRNASSVAAFFALNGTLSVNGSPSVGRCAITEVAEGFMTAFPDLHLLMDDLVVQHDRAVYHWTFIGTNSGPGGTGQRVRFSGFEVWKFGEDGLIAESDGHFDSVDYQRQLEYGVEEPEK